MKIGKGDLLYEVAEGWGKLPKGWSYVDAPGIAVDSQDRVYVFNRGGHPVIIFDREGNFITAWGEGIFDHPHSIYVGPDGAVYCTDYWDHTLRKFSPDGKLLMTLGTEDQPSDSGGHRSNVTTVKRGAPPFNGPTNLFVTPSGEIYVTDGYGNARVHKFAPDGRLVQSFGEPGRGPGQFMLPHGIVVTPNGTIYVVDRENDRIQLFNANGEFITQWKEIWRPNGLWLGVDGLLYVPELGHQVAISHGRPEPTPESPWCRLGIYDLNGKRLARLGTDDFTLPGSFYTAHGIATDSRGDIYVGETSFAGTKGHPPVGSHELQMLVRIR